MTKSNEPNYKPLVKIPAEDLPHTFTYLGFDKVKFPTGTVAVVSSGRVWVTDIPSTLETCLLVNRLVMHIIKTNRKNNIAEYDVDIRQETFRALLELVDCARIVIHRTKINKDINSSAPQIRLVNRLLPSNRNKSPKLIQDASEYLRFYPFRQSLTINDNVASIETDIIVRAVNENTLILKRAIRNDNHTIAFLFSGYLYLTNILATEDEIKRVQYIVSLMRCVLDVNHGAANTHQVIHSFMHSINLGCYSKVNIRPAYFARNSNGTIRLRQRHFIITERKLHGEESLVAEAVNTLLSVKQTTSGKPL